MAFPSRTAFVPLSSTFSCRKVAHRVAKCETGNHEVGASNKAFLGRRKASTPPTHKAKQFAGPRMTTATAFPALVLRHLGTWEGTYRILDAKSGGIVDKHACKIEVGIRGERYSQRNTYTWDDGRQQIFEFAGRMIDGVLQVASERLEGRVILLGKDALCFYAKRKDADFEIYDVIMLLTEDTRARTWSVIGDDQVTQIVQVDESRTSRDDAYFDVKNDPWGS